MTPEQILQEVFIVKFFYDGELKARSLYCDLPEQITDHLKQSQIEEFACPCGCGLIYDVVSKQRIEEIIEFLRLERVKSLN